MNQEELYQLFEKSTTAIVVFDTQKGVRYANQYLLQLLTYERQQLQNQPFTSLVHTSWYADFESFVTAQEKAFHRTQIYMQGAENLSISADLTVQRISKQNTVPAVYVASVYPLNPVHGNNHTSEKTSDTSFSETQSLLNLLKKETDIPLSTLNTLAERLLSLQPRSDQMPLLENILHSSHQLQGAVEQVLLYADLLSGRIQPDSQPFNLYKLLKELEDVYYKQAQERGIDFKLLTDDDIPTPLIGDVYFIRQILEKILDHLLTFTSEKSIKVQVLLESKIASVVLLKISLILELTSKHLLWLRQIFLSSSSSLPQEWGSIGLYIADKLIKKTGGAISLENDHITGVGIHISLPLTLEEDNSKRELAFTEDLAHNKAPLQGLKVLYVEDVIPNHFLMEGLCSIWQVSLDTALNGKEALDKIQHNLYDVILMDLQMPIMDGYETSQRIRKGNILRNSSVPIIAVSGSATDEAIVKIKAYGMDAMLSKPIKPDELYRKLIEFTS